MSSELTPEQREEAALAAIREVRKSATHNRRRDNPVIDVSSTEAASTLAEWVIESQGAGTCRSDGTKVSAIPFTLSGISASGAQVDMATGTPGAAVWAVLPMTLGKKRFTVLIGAVKLKTDNWSLIRRTLTVQGLDVSFAQDEVWYETRRKRTHEITESGKTRRPPRRR